MSTATSPPRAGILVTGTEVLSGIISDRNGPWVSERLTELGVDVAMIEVVGDRPEDLVVALGAMRDAGMAVIVTSGGLGPTADDLTAEVVGTVLRARDGARRAARGRIHEILRPLMARWPDLDEDAVRRANRKQAVVPDGSDRARAGGNRAGPRGATDERRDRCGQPDRGRAARPAARAAGDVGRGGRDRRVRRRRSPARSSTGARSSACSGCRSPRSPTRSRRPRPTGSGSTSSRSPPACDGASSRSRRASSPRRPGDYDALLRFIRDRHARYLFSEDGSTIDEQIAALLRGDDPARTHARSRSPSRAPPACSPPG